MELADPVGRRLAARWLPLVYVLVPSTRAALDRDDVGPLHRRRLAVARAVVSTREGRGVSGADLQAITPGLVATAVPLPWAMVLAAGLTADRVAEGRQIAEYLLDLYGEPAREVLRGTTAHPRGRVADGARKLLAAITTTPLHPVRLDVLGRTLLRVGDSAEVNLHWNRDRVRSLLLYLVVHGPAHREQIIDALWPHLDIATGDRNLRVTLTYLNQVLEPHRRNGEATFFVRQTGRTLTLAGPPHVEVDLREFQSLLDRAEDADRNGLATVALDLYERALQRWRGPCLADVAYEEWAQPACRDLTTRYVEATRRTAELHLAAGRIASAINAARRALAADEWVEPAYCILIAAALERRDCGGAVQALRDCDAMLDELGIAAGEQTEMLRRRLHAHQPEQPRSAMAVPHRTGASAALDLGGRRLVGRR
ncbi:MAG: BTAD domain-containing putative transcriptional regulator, partial [Ilumatobacteraceae bacterium]